MKRDRDAPAGSACEGARGATLDLLAARAPDATVCPSEVARALAMMGPGAAASAWRSRMAEVHAAVDQLMAGGAIRLSWKGSPLTARAGPYRIGRGGSANATSPVEPES